MWRVPCISWDLADARVGFFLTHTFHTYSITLYFSLKNVAHTETHKRGLSLCTLGPRDFIILPRPACSRPPDLVTSKSPP